MNANRLFIPYSGNPIEALQEAIRRFGDSNAYILVPAEKWDRVVSQEFKGSTQPKGLKS
jgi:hypothetical protein